jgi:exportin-2 (importin alpha re-exporter)
MTHAACGFSLIYSRLFSADVAEFAPYVFQILSQLVEVRLPPLPPNYMALFSPLLTPLLWERSANVPALVRLLQAYLQKAPHEIISQQKLPAVLGVFQKLIASKHTDHQGFFILNTVVENLPIEVSGRGPRGNRVVVLERYKLISGVV